MHGHLNVKMSYNPVWFSSTEEWHTINNKVFIRQM